MHKCFSIKFKEERDPKTSNSLKLSYIPFKSYLNIKEIRTPKVLTVYEAVNINYLL